MSIGSRLNRLHFRKKNVVRYELIAHFLFLKRQLVNNNLIVDSQTDDFEGRVPGPAAVITRPR